MGGNKEFLILAASSAVLAGRQCLYALCIPMKWSLFSSAAVQVQEAGEKIKLFNSLTGQAQTRW